MDAVEGAVISAVNMAEVQSKLSDIEFAYPLAFARLLRLIDRIEPFTEIQAKLSGELRRSTKPFGLSLGDRACLAVALDLGAEVYTMERIWAKVDVGCTTHVMR